MLTNETKRRIDTARDILVGKLPDPKTQVEQITIALIYKFMDDMDKQAEELGGKPKFFTGDYAKYAWSRIFDPRIGGHELVGLYGEAIQKMNQNPNIPKLFRDIFKNAYLPYRDPETLKHFLKCIGEFEYDHSEKLGDAFEYLLSVMGSQGDAGQFRTPRHIIDFIVSVVEPSNHDTILDPACGTAGFLISSYKYILEKNTKDGRVHLTPAQKKRLIENFSGYDISPDMVRLSLANMYLHGFRNPNIHEYDTLTSEEKWQEVFDVILANPPFMSPRGGIRPHKRFGVQSNRSEVLFVDYITEHLNPNGRAGIIVPEGIIFHSGTAYKKLRYMLIEHSLYAVVSLPAGVFNPYSGVKTSILLLDKNLAKKTENILFLKVNNDGYGLGAQRREIKDNDLPLALAIIKKYKQSIVEGKALKFRAEETKICALVKKEKIAASKDYNLSSDRYKSVIIYNGKWDFVEMGEVATIESGSRQKGGAVSSGSPSIGGEQIDQNGSIRFEKMKYVTKEHFRLMKKGVLRKGDVLIVKDGATTGKSGYFDEDREAAVNEHVFILRAKNNILPIYLYNIIRSENFQNKLQRYIKGIIGGISLEIKEIKIPLPPLETQEQIITELDSYQKVIEGARQVVENYRPHIDIDPDWEMIDFEKICTLEYGNSLPKKHRKGDKYPVMGSNGIAGYHDEFIVKGPAIIVGRKGSAGEVVWIDSNCFPIDTTYYVQLKDKKYNFKFLYYVLLGLDLPSLKGGAGIPGLNRNDAYRIHRLPYPNRDIQDKIVEQIDSEQQIVTSNKQLIEIYEQKIKERVAKVWGVKT
jgi:type I restriction enzyme M protein